ncbi:sulfite exporter TauE/SafE family protein [Bacillus rubiinfantis]|uniref:sulfite exporter TauE/SafE family protein n=1 Tax=Bacillus rubiinfantis TaxID=1499680 RepID=UPI0005A6B627|nr:sulfite exporter TauE/SafE family protein [Bacillus rubiinfantis]
MAITMTMFVMGIIIGFVGAGGSGFIIAILTVLFGIPIHTALGTSLAAMVFTTVSGAYSHFRAGNVALQTGVVTGIIGSLFAYLGSEVAGIIPVHSLHWFTAGMLFLSAVLLVFRLFIFQQRQIARPNQKPRNANFWLRAALVGAVTGFMSGTFGIGAAPFIQIGLLIFIGLSVRQAVGTTMLVILPIAVAGGAGYYFQGFLDIPLLLQVVAGTMAGSYVGAKFTSLAPQPLLKGAMVITPIAAGTILLIS